MPKKLNPFQSFRFSLIFTTMFFIILGISLSLLITTVLFSRGMEEKNKSQAMLSFAESEDNILRLLSDVYCITNSTYNTDSVANCILNEFATDKERILARFRFTVETSNYVTSATNISSIVFLNDFGRMAGISINNRFFSETGDFPFYMTLKELQFKEQSETLWLDNIKLSDFVPYGNINDFFQDRNIVCGLRRYTYHEYRTNTVQPVFVLFELNANSLHKCFSHMISNDSDTYLLNEDGQIICGSGSAGAVPEFFTSVGNRMAKSFHYTNSAGIQCQVIYYPLSIAGWSFAKCIPRSIYTTNIRILWISAAVVGLSILLFMSILYTIWANKFCLPISNLVASIRMVKSGNLDARVPTDNCRSTEMRIVCQQYNEMLGDINQLLMQKENSERERMALEIRMLQAQVTPHFFYNTLTSIRWMASASGAENVAEALLVFSNIIRPIFSIWRQEWHLSEEFEFVSNYIHLMRMRLGNRISISSHIDDAARRCLIPRFTLQTLLENCCEHGIDADRVLHISLRSEIRDGMLYTSVQDDGVGIPQEKLERIRQMISSGDDTTSVGLVNLNRRIKLYFGEDCGLQINSELGKGTEILLCTHILY